MFILQRIRAALLCAAVVLAAVPPALAQTPPDTLIYATGTDAQTLDPQMINDLPTSRVVMHMHETLIQQDEQGALQPGLATSWQLSPDNLTWTFKLRENVTFHDGTPFNAEAVKVTFDRMMDPATGSPRRSTLDMVDRVEVVDNYTVAVVTKQPYAPLLSQLSAYNLAILSPKQVKEVGMQYAAKPMGTGPYRLDEWVRGEYITLVRNDAYWGEKPPLQRLRFNVVPEDSSRVLLLLSGQADVISSIPTVMLDRLEGNKAIDILRKPGYRTVFLGMNMKLKPFDDLRVRQAVAHAIDPKALLDGILKGVGTLGGSIESPAVAGAKELPNYAYDPELSRKLLAEAGYPNGFEASFYVPTGRYLMDRTVGQAIQAQLAKVGIKANIQSPEWGAMMKALLQQKDQAQLFILGKGSPTGDPDFTMTLSLMTDERVNASNLSDAELDRMIVAQRSQLDPAERNKTLAAIQDRVYELIPHVVLFHEDQLYAARSSVEGIRLYPNEFISFAQARKR